MTKLNRIYLTLSLLFSVLFFQCKEESSQTFFNLRMTDGPLDATEVNIDLQGIIVIADGQKDSFDITTHTGIYNLLDFQNGIDTLIASSFINAQEVNQIRLILGENNSILVDSTLHELSTPSAQQAGLKINVQQDISNIDTFNLLIDFDAEASIHETGNGKYQLRPVIKVIN